MGKPASEQVDEIIKKHGGWKTGILTKLRALITSASPTITEDVKWKMPTRPEGLPVWSYNGIVCFAEIWKDNVKLIFFTGAKLDDQDKLFNTRLKSRDVRAIELREGDSVNEAALERLVAQAVAHNSDKTS